ncbi:MAG: ATP-grasp domain-containing protein [Candidatus Sericytochromatia bacterium]
MKNVLFTGGRSPFTLDLTRLFATSGFNVYIADTFKDNMSGNSKYAKKNILLASPALKTEDFIQDLIDIIIEYKIDLLIPTCEEVFYVGKYLKKLEKFCKVFVSDISVLEQLHSKYKFIGILNKLDIKHPKSERVSDINVLKNRLQYKEKFVLKPEFSRFASTVFINDKNIDNIKINKEYPWVLQEFIDGNAFCSYSVAQNGKLLAHGVYPSIYCAGKATIHFKSVKVSEIEEIVTKIVKNFDYTGQISFDFIQSKEDNIYYPIECNPRGTSGTHLFSKKLSKAFLNETNGKVIYPDLENPRMVALAMLIYELPTIRNIDDSKEFFRDFYKSKDVVFRVGDMKPFISQFKSLNHYAKIARKNNISLTEAIMYDIEWNGN